MKISDCLYPFVAFGIYISPKPLGLFVILREMLEDD